MKKICNLVFIIAVLFGFCFVAKAATKDTIIMSANKTEVKEGENVVITFSINTDKSFVAGAFKYTFDDTKLEVVSVAGLSGFTTTPLKDPTTNELLPKIAFQQGTAKTGSVTLVKLTFKALAAFEVGTTTDIVITNAEIGNDVESYDITGATKTITRIAGQVTPDPDPEPDPKDEDIKKTSLGYGIYTEDGEKIDSKYDKITPKAGSTEVTDTTVSIYPKADTKSDAMCIVYRSTKANSGFEKIGVKVKCSGAYKVIDEDLKPETTYYYRIRIYGGKNISDAIKITTKAKGYLPDTDKKSSDGSNNNKNGTINPIDTGVATPIAAISLLGAGFIFIKKATKKNSLIKL